MWLSMPDQLIHRKLTAQQDGPLHVSRASFGGNT